MIEIAGDEPTAKIRARWSSRARAPRCAAGNWRSATRNKWSPIDIDLEIDHGARAAIVGDNGQGKTTFLRTVVDSLPAAGRRSALGLRLRDRHLRPARLHQLAREQTVLEYLEHSAQRRARKRKHILDLAGALLFRGEHVEKSISVLSGGERARLCLAGLLLGNYNVLVLDEPGNHLDVDTVEALAKALDRLSGNGGLHQPRSALSEARGDIDHRSSRRPRGQLSRRLRSLSVLGQQRNRRCRAAAACRSGEVGEKS